MIRCLTCVVFFTTNRRAYTAVYGIVCVPAFVVSITPSVTTHFVISPYTSSTADTPSTGSNSSRLKYVYHFSNTLSNSSVSFTKTTAPASINCSLVRYPHNTEITSMPAFFPVITSTSLSPI